MTWSGTCTSGKAEGQGTMLWRCRKDGKAIADRTTGTMAAGKWVGHTVVIHADGYRFEGDPNGRGVSRNAKGDRYEGEYREWRWHGRGVVAWAIGDRYEGAYVDSKVHGFGTYTTANGTVYSGYWSNGCFRQGDRWATIGATKEECGFRDQSLIAIIGHRDRGGSGPCCRR